MAAERKQGEAAFWLVGLAWLAALAGWAAAGLWARLPQPELEAGGRAAGLVWSGAASVAAVLTLAAVGASILYALACERALREQGAALLDTVRRLQTGQTQQTAILTQTSENILLSDAIKSVAFREKDLTVLREAIQEDIRTERWSSAGVLIKELADRFGCVEESRQLAAELERCRQSTAQEKIDAAVAHIESLWMIRRYEEAEREARQLIALYPTSEKLRGLPEETQQRREDHKKELLARWDQAVKNSDFEQAVELIKLLDAYLTPGEAAALEESARGVFRGKLHNLGVQFSMSVMEKAWDKALQIGRQIVEEYPNSRMAQEVREKMGILEQRSREAHEAG